MAFKFNFSVNSGAGDGAETLEPVQVTRLARNPGVEVVPELQAADVERMERVALTPAVMLLKGRVDSVQAASLLGNSQLAESDLVPGKYEGGFKLWEGALDLCRYLMERYSLSHLSSGSSGTSGTSGSPAGPVVSSHGRAAASPPSPTGRGSLSGKAVMELGCGHGLPGIVTALGGARCVHFQDFNKEVLETLTGPNVGANLAALPPGAAPPSIRYFSGDWLSVGQLLLRQGLGAHYDLVLAAETIYSEESQRDLLECIKQVLQPPRGIALIAAKSYYFGVGGGTATFAERVRADGILECRSVWSSSDGDSVKREVLELKFPDCLAPYFL